MTTHGPTSTMAREIAEQPVAIAATFDALRPLRVQMRDVAARAHRVLFVARGSSDNAAVYGRYLCEVHTGVPAALAAPSVATHYRSSLDLSDTVAVSISQSGRTEEIVETQAWAADCGARTIAITNDGASPLADAADLALVTRAGDERAVPATKSYTAQLAAVAVLVDALGVRPGRLDDQLAAVPEEVARLLGKAEGVDAAVEQLVDVEQILVSGRGIVYGTALEVALKLEETCLDPVRGLSYADLRHGPIAVVERGLVAVLATARDGPMVDGMTELAHDLARRGATIVGLGGDDGFAAACDTAVAGPRLPEAVAPLGLIVPAQLIVETLARRRGLDPDAPRGLSKVTQTDPG